MLLLHDLPLAPMRAGYYLLPFTLTFTIA